MQENPKREVLIHEDLPGRDIKQEDLSGKCLIDSTIQSIKLQDGRSRFVRAQNTRFQNISIDQVLCDKGYYQDCSWGEFTDQEFIYHREPFFRVQV